MNAILGKKQQLCKMKESQEIAKPGEKDGSNRSEVES